MSVTPFICLNSKVKLCCQIVIVLSCCQAAKLSSSCSLAAKVWVVKYSQLAAKPVKSFAKMVFANSSKFVESLKLSKINKFRSRFVML